MGAAIFNLPKAKVYDTPHSYVTYDSQICRTPPTMIEMRRL